MTANDTKPCAHCGRTHRVGCANHSPNIARILRLRQADNKRHGDIWWHGNV